MGDGRRVTVTAVILAHDRRDAVLHVLDQLEDQPLAEVIVVDSGSSDGTADAVRSRPASPGMPVRVIDAGGNVAVAGRNLAARQASTEYLLMLDDDAYPLPGAVEALAAALDAAPRTGVVGGLVRDVADGQVVITDQLGSFDWWLSRGRVHEPGVAGTPTFFFPEGACMVRREAYLEVGGFYEPYFFTVSELDLATRLLAAGWDVRYLPEAVFDHMKVPAGRIANPLVMRLRVRNQLWYFWRHFPAGLAVRRMVAYLGFDLVDAAYRGATRAWGAGIAEAWRARAAVIGDRRPLPRDVLRRAEMDRGRLHLRLLAGQLRQKAAARTRRLPATAAGEGQAGGVAP